jgi:hypothetical protein
VPVVYDVPVATAAPPVAVVYQFTVPALAVAPNVTVPSLHLEAGVVEEILGIGVTVATIAVLEAVVQLPEVAST